MLGSIASLFCLLRTALLFVRWFPAEEASKWTSLSAKFTKYFCCSRLLLSKAVGQGNLQNVLFDVLNH